MIASLDVDFFLPSEGLRILQVHERKDQPWANDFVLIASIPWSLSISGFNSVPGASFRAFKIPSKLELQNPRL